MTEVLEILKRTTLKRLLNGLKVVLSYYYSRISGNPIQWGYPISLAIEPTTSCNLRCPECPSGLRSFSRPTGMLKEEFFRKTIDEISPYTGYLTFYFQGEPYLNPSFLYMVALASKKNMYTNTSTNAHYLTDENCKKTIESGLSRIIISIDGTTQDTYEKYRIGGNLEKVLEGTKRLIEWKKKLKSKTPHIIFQYLVVRHNEHQLKDARKLAKDIGVDAIKFKTAQVYDFEGGNDLIPLNKKYARYIQNKEGKFEINNKLLNHCWKLWSACVITWDGNVVPCCFDKDATHQFGNLNTETFQDVWQNTHYQSFRSALLKSRKEIDICANCSEGTKVWT
ncbi:MAG: SPASM domain-containing protein [Bacteroidetes bacterium]|nr:SPASM domain-containing protein [Bacteroidota bacterium]